MERAGYGYSDDSNQSRDVMEVLSETRQALSQADVTGPFIICLIQWLVLKVWLGRKSILMK